MKIGIDLDGTITYLPDFLHNFHQLKLPWLCAIPIIFLSMPKKRMLKFLRERKKVGDKIIIISARPIQLEKSTEWWLKICKIPYDKLYFVGLGNNAIAKKIKIIKEEGIEIYLEHSYIKEQSKTALIFLIF